MSGSLDRNHVVLIGTTFVTAASFAFVTARFVSRRIIVKETTIDDWLILAAWTAAFGMSFTTCYATSYGLGTEANNILPSHLPMLGRLAYTSEVLYNPALMLTKTSILSMYHRLFSTNSTFRRFNLAVIMTVNIGGIAFTFLNAFRCSPPTAAFQIPQMARGNAHCTSILTIFLCSAPLNIIMDIAILLLPMPLLAQLHLPRKQTLVLIVTFGFGIFVTIIDVIRIDYLQRADLVEATIASSNGTSVGNSATQFYWNAALSFLWSAIEVHVGIMCACVPSLKPLANKIMPILIKSSREVNEMLNSPEAGFSNNFHGHDVSREDGVMTFAEILIESQKHIEDTNVAEHKEHASSSDDPKEHPSDFVQLPHLITQKSLADLSTREALRPCIIFTTTFFIWGFEYGLLDILNQQFQVAAGTSAKALSSLHSAYYTGYFFGPIAVGYHSLRHWNLKGTCLVGLGIYACGTLIFWPAAVLTSYPTYFVTNFIVGLGLSNLEVAANPYLVLCGPLRYGATRLCLAQGVQAVGSVIAVLIASSTFARSTSESTAPLLGTQWAYFGMSIFTVAYGVLFALVRLPDLNFKASQDTRPIMMARFRSMSTVLPVVALGTFSLFCYVGGQEVNNTTFPYFLSFTGKAWNVDEFSAIAHAAFAASRFIFAGLAIYFPARILLLISYLGLMVFQALVASRAVDGAGGVATLILSFFFEGSIFPLIFALTLQNAVGDADLISVCLTAAISGGAVLSPLALLVQRAANPANALYTGLGAFTLGAVYPVWINFNLKSRRVCG